MKLLCRFLLAIALFAAPSCLLAAEGWESDYGAAVRKATAEKKMLLVYFADGRVPAVAESAWLADAGVARSLANYVMLKLPADAEVATAEGKTKLLSHAAFGEMQGSPGLSVLDYTQEKGPNFGQVVSIYPFNRAGTPSARELQMLLTLPTGTLTQRTLILAVRLHPEGPASTTGEMDAELAAEAQSHAQHQANIRLQGHHSWESRFHRINSLLSRRRGGAWSSTEVCAESWPGQGLWDSAVECVHSWRQSSGHWSAVRSAHSTYSYDMKRGSNGIWYAAGIFGNFR